MKIVSPAGLRVLRGLFPKLPSNTTIKTWLSGLPSGPGFHDEILTVLKTKFQGLKEQEKLCIITFDEMSIQSGQFFQDGRIYGIVDYGKTPTGSNDREDKVAKHALAFMARGLISNWQQPLGYFFVGSGTKANKLEELVRRSIEAVEGSGGIVIGLVCDQAPVNVTVYKKHLKASVEKTYFEYENG